MTAEQDMNGGSNGNDELENELYSAFDRSLKLLKLRRIFDFGVHIIKLSGEAGFAVVSLFADGSHDLMWVKGKDDDGTK